MYLDSVQRVRGAGCCGSPAWAVPPAMGDSGGHHRERESAVPGVGKMSVCECKCVGARVHVGR